MLEIVYSPDWKALSSCARRRIVADARQKKGGRVLIVPEQYSFETERALCGDGGDQISRYAEVLSFSRLAERACASCGGVAGSVMDQGGRVMALAETVSRVRSRLQFYARSASRADFLEQMLSIVDELKCYRITPAQLSGAAARLEGDLAVKTQELALLLEGYEGVCAKARPDPRDRLEQLLDHIMTRDFGTGLRLFVDGFLGFTSLELEILGAFLAQGTDVTVFLCCDKPFDGAQVFSTVHACAAGLKREADRCGAEVRITKLDAPLPAIGAAALSAFTRQAAEDVSGLRLYECEGPGEEVDAICADILAHVRGGGRFRDVAVACASPGELLPILESEFERCGIPAFFAGKKPALRTALISGMLSALRAASGRMEQEDVVAYLRSDGAAITPDECDRLENYAFVWSISGERWAGEWTGHPRGLDKKMKPADRQTLAQVNELRDRYVLPLLQLRAALKKCATVGECVVAFYDFLQITDFSGCISVRLAELERSDPPEALLTQQLYELLINAMEQLYGVQCDAQTTPEDFLRLMEILLAQYQVGAIPAVLDAVTVGQCAALQHRHSPLVFLCGCADGSFPQPAAGGSLLNEAERSRLRAAGVELAPDENEQMDRNLAGAYALLSAADTRLTISASGQSAWLFTILKRLYPEAVSKGSDAPPTDFATEKTLGLRLARCASAEGAPAAAAEYCGRLRRAAEYDFGRLSGDTVLGLYGGNIFLSASRIDRLAACRFHFFLNDGLEAEERKAAKFEASNFGTFVHNVMESTVRQVMEEGGFHEVERDRVLQIAKRCMDEELRRLADTEMNTAGRFTYLMTRNSDEVLRVVDVLCGELRESAFAPADFELKFGEGGLLPPVRVDAGSGPATVCGAVDRVDLARIGDQTYFRVVDYKTGYKDFDYTDLLERRGLQMLIYMFAVEQYGSVRYGGRVRPAGVLYIPAHDDLLRFSARPQDDGKTRQDRIKSHWRQGLLLDNESVLQAMGPEGGTAESLLPYRVNTKSARCDLMDGGQLNALRRYVDAALQSVTDEIRSGSVDPNPYIRGDRGPCNWCPYASVCHLDLHEDAKRSLSYTGADEFWTRLEREEAHHG